MAGGKETPSQKMIGLMYMVLTAMLALNVSKVILNGYLSVNDSLEKSKKNIEENNKRITEAFKSSVNGNPKAAPYFNQALAAQKDLNEMYKYVDDIKGSFMGAVIGLPEGTKVAGDTIHLRAEMWRNSLDNYDIPTQQLIGADEHNPKTGALSAHELKTKMEGLYNKLVGQLDKMQKTEGEHLLPEDYENLKRKIAVLKPV